MGRGTSKICHVFGVGVEDEKEKKHPSGYFLSRANPCYGTGKAAHSVGSCHTPANYVWPIGLCMQALTSREDEEAAEVLRMLLTTHAGTCLMHDRNGSHWLQCDRPPGGVRGGAESGGDDTSGVDWECTRKYGAHALARSSVQQDGMQPLDWMENNCPVRWLVNGQEQRFSWLDEAGQPWMHGQMDENGLHRHDEYAILW